METICIIIDKALELMPGLIPQDWDESMVIQLDGGTVTFAFRNGKVSFVEGETADAESVVRLSRKQLCDFIDGTTDFMTVWRLLAEPSPTDRTYILKGSGAKFFTLLDILIRCYNSHGEFRKSVDAFRAGL